MGFEERRNPPGFIVGRKSDEKDEEIPEGQCFFVNYFKVRRRRLWRGLKIQAAAEPQDLQSGDEEDDNDDQSPNVVTSPGEWQGQEDLEVVAGPDDPKV